MRSDLLCVRDLVVELPSGARLLDGVSLTMAHGQRLAVVGESGAGKTVLALAVLGLVPPPGRIVSGSIRVHGQELVGADSATLTRIRGGVIALVFQEPSSALNPVFSIGFQLREAIRQRRGLARSEVAAEAERLLHAVGLDNTGGALPSELSGGQLQRAMIAIALAGDPSLVIADEPTSGLDPVTRAEVLGVLLELTVDLDRSLIWISHDLELVAPRTDLALVLLGGEVVEHGPSDIVLSSPAHPYSRWLVTPGDELRDEADARAPGCRFAGRCPLVEPSCRRDRPALEPIDAGSHLVRCPVVLGRRS